MIVGILDSASKPVVSEVEGPQALGMVVEESHPQSVRLRSEERFA
jgi:hypothetical protein